MLQKQVPLEWINWLKDNLSKGCAAGALAKIMLDKGFSQAVVFQIINALANPASAVQIDVNNPSSQALADLAHLAGNFKYEKPRFNLEANYIDTSDRRIYIAAKLNQPVVVVLDDFMSDEECDHLIALSRGKMEISKVVDDETGIDAVHAARTSSGTFFEYHANDLISCLERRAAELMNWPEQNGEGLQILNYKPGAEYSPHFDYFPYDIKGSLKHLAMGGQRVSTLIIYLNEVEAGGETAFPELGLRVVPKKGSAVYFEYCNSLGQVDKQTLHAGLPVIKGEKWIATKWMRQFKYN